MKNSRRFFKKKRFIIPLSLLLLLALANSCISLRMSDKEIVKSFKKAHQNPKIYHSVYKGKKMRYVASKPFDNNLPTVLFLHGAPGSSSDFYRYLKDTLLSAKANLISIDRLGYGYSDYGKAETSLTEQAQSAYHILTENKAQNVIVMGWSYGGPIAVKLTVLHSDIIKHIILIAPAISPKDEKYFALGKLAYWKATRWAIPRAFRVAEDEKLTHVKELNLLLPDWPKIKTPISYYHGDKDKIVPFANYAFIEAHVAKPYLKMLRIQGGNHFLMFKHYTMVRDELLHILENISKKE
jgi:pimeloyl-ACP methyl ester carboxylesterase